MKLLNIDAQVHPTARKNASGFQEKKTQKENTKMHQFLRNSNSSHNWRDFYAKLKQRGSPVAYVQTGWSET